ncbi:hypothetical protein V3C99_007915 [Haemonchus contortus]|uniref:Uncharacterized protein n=1 Tax=Haemonchus contortus TaxID=6289 RepID=A0A7I4YM86_HAECO
MSQPTLRYRSNSPERTADSKCSSISHIKPCSTPSNSKVSEFFVGIECIARFETGWLNVE